MNEKKAKLLTPVGFAKWAWLNKPKLFKDEKGNPKGEPKFQIEVYFDPTNPEWKTWAGTLQALINSIPVQKNGDGEPMPKQKLFRKELDEHDVPTGRFFVTFKTNEKFKPGVFDKYGQEMPDSVMVGNESAVRVNYSPSTYTAFGGGVNLYLNAVQVINLIEYKSHTAKSFGFEAEALPPGQSAPPQAEDDLPF